MGPSGPSKGTDLMSAELAGVIADHITAIPDLGGERTS